MKPLLPALILTLSCIPFSVSADVYFCDGKWTNRPCEDTPQFPDTSPRESGPAVTPEEAQLPIDAPIPEDNFQDPKAPEPQMPIPELNWGDHPETPGDYRDHEADGATPAATSTPMPKPSQIERCGSGEVWTEQAPPPFVESNAQRLGSRGGMGESYKLSGQVRGHGRVEVTLKLSGRVGNSEREKNAWSQSFTFPAEGGTRTFETRFDLPSGWQWTLTANNQGRFSGFCSPQ